MTTLFEMPFDKPLAGPGAVRTWSGHICAAVVCRSMGWQETSTGNSARGSCVPDAVSPEGFSVEIKAISYTPRGKFCPAVLYKFRIDKEIAALPLLLYAFVAHAKLGSPRTLGDLHRTLAATPIIVSLVPARIVHEHALTHKLCVPNWLQDKSRPRVGYNREGYNQGYYTVDVNPWFNNATTDGFKHRKKVVFEGLKFNVFAHRAIL